MEFGYIVIRYRNLSLYCKSWYRDTTVCAFILILITTLEDRAIISKRYFVHFKKVVLFWLTTYQSWVSVQFCSQNWYIQWIRIVSTMSHALHSSFQGSIVDLTKKGAQSSCRKICLVSLGVHLFRMYSSRQLYVQDEHFN